MRKPLINGVIMSNSKKALVRDTRTTLDFYHSPTQLRFDTWNRLEEYASRLNQKYIRKADNAALTEKTRKAISLLQTIENYSAFPSEEDFKLIWELFEQEDFNLLAKIVSRIVRALTNGTYRIQKINLRVSGDHEERDELNQHYDDDRQQQRPLF